MGMSLTNFDSLPEECVSTILSFTSPPDACRFSMVSTSLRSASDSDMLWLTFLPSDYRSIVSRSMTPLAVDLSSRKNLFYALCRPLLLDGGNTSFKLDKFSGKKSYILSARELSIEWGTDPMYWSWRPMAESRFKEVAELRTVSWLEIEGKINTKNLTQNTLYGAYLIMRVSHRGYGLDSVPCEVTIIVANRVIKSGKAYLWHKDEKKGIKENSLDGVPVPSRREDDNGWMEIEIGEFFSCERDEEVKMSVMDIGYHLKGGLIIEGIEVRPK
ncbi:hypothetical protein HN51_054749 [Arachis hypogaea]|uniref:F-box protein n=1 Tax=Arachis hypogaea TaxID=3818 RepID=A0A444XKI0_ARAHY|nr:F-box protein PP2-B15 [Arachis ipaensis]XP_025677121.1 F-box protein PP2-B15 [Arachis hypogaea]QHN77354.1 F-box protein [Arachis hypogaea]RYQ90162.1 hypothetical protein Ahy_B09g096412 [Arachis hypogaea]